MSPSFKKSLIALLPILFLAGIAYFYINSNLSFNPRIASVVNLIAQVLYIVVVFGYPIWFIADALKNNNIYINLTIFGDFSIKRDRPYQFYSTLILRAIAWFVITIPFTLAIFPPLLDVIANNYPLLFDGIIMFFSQK